MTVKTTDRTVEPIHIRVLRISWFVREIRGGGRFKKTAKLEGIWEKTKSLP